MANLWWILFALACILPEFHGQNQFLREVKTRKVIRVRKLRPNRQVFVQPENGEPLNYQRAAAVVDDAARNKQAIQLLLQHIAATNPQTQIDRSQNTPGSENDVVYVDQYGRIVQQEPAQTRKVLQQRLRYVDQNRQEAQEVSPPQQNTPQQNSSPQNVPQQNPQQQQNIRYVDQYGREVQNPNVQHQLVQHVATAPFVKHPQYQQVFSPHGLVYQQQLQHVHQYEVPQPHVHQIVIPQQYLHQVSQQVAVPSPVYHQTFVPGYPPQFPVFINKIIPKEIPQPVVHLKQYIQPQITFPAPAVIPLEKVAVPLVKKVVEVKPFPEVHLIRQPIIPPAIFQKEIFAIKNPPHRVLTYSDLCTVYPYQRKLSGCVQKKASIPELHHPDIQLVSQQSIHRVKSTILSEKNPKTLIATTQSTRVENIQEILRENPNESADSVFRPLEPQNDDSNESQEKDDESVAPSNKNVKISTNKGSNKVTKSKTTTSTTEPSTDAPTTVEEITTTRKPKTKRRSRNGSKRTTSRKKSNKGSSSTTTSTTTEKSFKFV